VILLGQCFIDDVIVYMLKSFEEHLTHLRATFAWIREKGVKLHPKKVKLAMPSAPYLGHEIVPNGKAPQCNDRGPYHRTTAAKRMQRHFLAAELLYI
jgi:hypothetical protein